jgi:hypothetical protein
MRIPEILLDPKRSLLMIQPFTYSINYASLATATSIDGSFTTQNDSDFIITKTTYYSAPATTAGPTESNQIKPWLTVLLTDSGSGRNLMAEAVMVDSLFGSAKLPFIWSMPYKVNGNSTMTASLANISTGAGEAYVCRLQFHGVKIFYGGIK